MGFPKEIDCNPKWQEYIGAPKEDEIGLSFVVNRGNCNWQIIHFYVEMSSDKESKGKQEDKESRKNEELRSRPFYLKETYQRLQLQRRVSINSHFTSLLFQTYFTVC